MILKHFIEKGIGRKFYSFFLYTKNDQSMFKIQQIIFLRKFTNNSFIHI